MPENTISFLVHFVKILLVSIIFMLVLMGVSVVGFILFHSIPHTIKKIVVMK